MADEVFELLRERWEAAGRPSVGYILPGAWHAETAKGGSETVFKRAMKKADLRVWDEARGKFRNKFTIHSFRRYYLSRIKEEHGLAVASESVGHASLGQTADYCRPVLEHPGRRATVAKIGAVFAPQRLLPAPAVRLLPAPDTTENTT